MKNNYLHLIACLLLLLVSGGRILAQGSVKPDTLFNKPYVDLEEWRDKPVRHYYVHGGFRGTDNALLVLLPS